MIGRGCQYSGPHDGGTLVRTTRFVAAIRIIALWKANFWPGTTGAFKHECQVNRKRILSTSLGRADAVSAATRHNRDNRGNQVVTATVSELCFQCLIRFDRQPMLPSSTSATSS